LRFREPQDVFVRIIRIVKNALFYLLRKRTIGARILLIKDKQILLVKHTYYPGWFTIGGAVDPGESPLQAIHRELQEEVGVSLKSPPRLFSVYYSNFEKHDDYIVFYIGEHFEQKEVVCDEILEKKWFDLDALPDDVSAGTERRVQEYLGKKSISDLW
jgi:8-oxo-dGTP pyrophosphatase MutT (NUDIX family)